MLTVYLLDTRDTKHNPTYGCVLLQTSSLYFCLKHKMPVKSPKKLLNTSLVCPRHKSFRARSSEAARQLSG